MKRKNEVGQLDFICMTTKTTRCH